MKKRFTCTICILLLITGSSAELLAQQVTITFPATRLVFQRNNNNQGLIFVAGRCPANTTQIQARMVERQGGVTTGWTVISSAPNNGTFDGLLANVSGGWYDLEVKAFENGIEIGNGLVQRVGVGEVFVTSGQSNSWGGSFGLGQAADDRVSIVIQPNFRLDGAGVFEESQLSLVGSQANLGPNGNNGMSPAAPLFMWGALGDRLVQRLGVPVMFFGASHPGTRSTDWYAAVNGEENVGNGYYSRNAPYRSLGATMLHYLKRTGARAVLWHQGESDNYYRTRDEYVTQIGAVIQRTRVQSGFNALGWVVARVSYLPASVGPEYVNHETDQNIIDAQNILASQPNNWPGPATDGMIFPDYRVEDAFHIHFGEADCQRLADVWSQSLSDEFFTNVQPSLPSRSILLTTGYVFPFTVSPSQTVDVPYVTAVPTRADNQYTVELLSEAGCVLATVGSGTTNPIPVTMPVWANGRYKFRVNATSPAIMGEVGEIITVSGSGNGLPPNYVPGPVASIRSGNWTDPTVWSCGVVPTVSDVVLLNHTITIPPFSQVFARQLQYALGSRLIYEIGGQLTLGQ